MPPKAELAFAQMAPETHMDARPNRMHLDDRARARRPAGAAAQPDHGDMTTANAESGQVRPANKPGRGRLQHTAFVVAMGAQPIGLLEVDAKLR